MAVAVVIPIYNAYEALVRCLEAVWSTIDDQADLILVDDASTDSRVRSLLANHARRAKIIRNAANAGFVVSANIGIDLAGNSDVILLNSDTVVTPGWIEGMQRCADSHARIASVTPWSNNGEIVSIPNFCEASNIPENTDSWMKACADAGPPEYPELPTAVGFCMFMTRRAIDDIGIFDEAGFGIGYGEENDWCMRARARGWKHLLCDDVYVAHEGGASFGPRGVYPDDESMSRLLERHPGYNELISEYIRRDPLSERRNQICSVRTQCPED